MMGHSDHALPAGGGGADDECSFCKFCPHGADQALAPLFVSFPQPFSFAGRIAAAAPAPRLAADAAQSNRARAPPAIFGAIVA